MISGSSIKILDPHTVTCFPKAWIRTFVEKRGTIRTPITFLLRYDILPSYQTSSFFFTGNWHPLPVPSPSPSIRVSQVPRLALPQDEHPRWECFALKTVIQSENVSLSRLSSKVRMFRSQDCHLKWECFALKTVIQSENVSLLRLSSKLRMFSSQGVS